MNILFNYCLVLTSSPSPSSLPGVLCGPTTSFESKGPHLTRWLVSESSSTVSYLRFSRVFLSCKANARFEQSYRYHFIITLSLTDRCDWCDTRGKWLWLGTQTGAGGTATLTWSFFWPQPMDKWCLVWISLQIIPFLSWYFSFSLPEVLCDPTKIIWR